MTNSEEQTKKETQDNSEEPKAPESWTVRRVWYFDGIVPVRIKMTHPDALIPEMQREGDACFDLFSVENWIIDPNERVLVDTGLQMEIPIFLEATIRPRSGLAIKKGITVLNSPGTIDSGYRDNVKVILINHSNTVQTITKGERIAQMTFRGRYYIEFDLVDELNDSERGEGGFGSTGSH